MPKINAQKLTTYSSALVPKRKRDLFYCFSNTLQRRDHQMPSISLAQPLGLVATMMEVLGGRLQQLQTGDVVVVQQLQHVLGVRIDLDDVLLQSGHSGHVVVATLALLLLQLDGDAAHLRVTQTAHQMRDVSVFWVWGGGQQKERCFIICYSRV